MNNAKTKKLGLITLTSLVAGNMIGSGVFLLPSDLARIGSISLFSWVFTALGAFLLAMVFSRMSVLIPKTGGPYAYAHAGFGNFIGFQTAYNYWVAVWIGNAAIVIALMGYLRVFFPFLANIWLNIACAIGIVWLLTLVNIIGIRLAGAVQLVTTILKFVPLLVVGLLGWFFFHPEYLTASFNITGKSHFFAFSHAATLTLWAFIGVESATVPAGSVDNPTRNIPLATLIGTMLAAFVYIASSAAIMSMLPASILINSTSPFVAAAKVIFGDWGGKIVAVGAIISTFGALNGWILIQGQIAMAPARDGLFPRLFAKCNKANVPARALAITSLCITLLLLATNSPNLVDQFQLAILMAATSSLIAYIYTAIAEIIVIAPHAKSRQKTINLWIAILAACYSLWAFFGSGKDIVFLVALLIFSSFPIYAWLKWREKP